MAKTKDDLHFLIHAMTGNERRYFRLQALEEANYLKLYDALLAQPEYDEIGLKKDYVGSSWLKGLPALRTYLLKQILRSMRSFREEKSVGSRIRGLVSDASFLLEKGMFRRAGKLLKQARKLGEEVEDFLALLEICVLERKLPQFASGKDIQADLYQLQAYQDSVLEQFTELQAFRSLYLDIFLPFLQKGKSEKPVNLDLSKGLLRHPLLSSDQVPDGFQAQTFYFQIRGSISRLQGRVEEADHFFGQAVAVWEAKALMIETDLMRYLYTLNGLLSIKSDQELYSEIPALLKLLGKIRSTKPRVVLTQKQLRYHYLLICWVNQALPEDEAPDLKEIAAWFKKTVLQLPQGTQMLFRYHLALGYFVAGAYPESLYWVNVSMQQQVPGIREDALQASHLLDLMVHFQMQNYELLTRNLRIFRRNKALSNGEVVDLLTGTMQQLLKLPVGDWPAAIAVAKATFANLPRQAVGQGIALMGLWLKQL